MSGSLSSLVSRHLAANSSGESAGLGGLANQMLSLVHRDGDLKDLTPLFECGSYESLRTLVFILSEIGTRAAEATGWLEVMLESSDDYVRYYAVVAVQHSGSLEAGEVTAKAVRLIGSDPTRLAVVRFLAFGSLRQLKTCIPYLDDSLSESLSWLTEGHYADAGVRLRDPDLALALVGLAGAARLREVSPRAFEEARESRRGEIARAAIWLSRFQVLPTDESDILHRIRAKEPPLN